MKPGKHEVLVRKLTEAFFGVVSFMGFLQSDGQVVFNPPTRNVRRPTTSLVLSRRQWLRKGHDPCSQVANNRRIEALGASFTCGYGVEGHYPCNFSPYTENFSK